MLMSSPRIKIGAQWVLSEKSALYVGRSDPLPPATRQIEYNTIEVPRLATPTNRVEAIAGPRSDHHRNPSRMFVQHPPSHSIMKKPTVQDARGASHGERTATLSKTSFGSARMRNGNSTVVPSSIVAGRLSNVGFLHQSFTGWIERLMSNMDLPCFPTTSLMCSDFVFHTANSMRIVTKMRFFSFDALSGDSLVVSVK